MAVVPTIESAKRAILEEISKFNVRPNEIFPIMQIQVHLNARGFREEEVHPALEQMVNDGWLLPKEGMVHWSITEAGYAEM